MTVPASPSGLLARAFSWWWTGLRSFLPERPHKSVAGRRHVQCRVENDTIELCLVESSGKSGQHISIDLGEGDVARHRARRWLASRRRCPLVLSLSPEQGLRRLLTLPVTARNELDSLIRFEMERQTPFRPDQVHSCHRVVGEVDGGRLQIELAVVPKKIVADRLEQISFLGREISAILLARPEGVPPWIEIPLERQEKPEAARTRRLNAWLLALCATEFLVLLYQPVNQYETRLNQLRQEIDTARKRATLARRLRSQNDGIEHRSRFLQAKLGKHRLRVDILEELAMLLPADTWLNRLEIRGNRVVMAGETSSADRLISLLSGSDSLENVSFGSPITRNPESGKERFSITAEITVPGGDTDA